jgi:hypothetical protein
MYVAYQHGAGDGGNDRWFKTTIEIIDALHGHVRLKASQTG